MCHKKIIELRNRIQKQAQKAQSPEGFRERGDKRIKEGKEKGRDKKEKYGKKGELREEKNNVICFPKQRCQGLETSTS